MKMRPVVSETFRADRRTDGRRDRHYEANSRFRNFANAPKERQLMFGRTVEAGGNMEAQSTEH